MEQKPDKITENETIKKPVIKPEGKPDNKPETDDTPQPKKKNIIQVFRPQNSKTGMVKPGSRPRPQGDGQPARRRPQGDGQSARRRPQGEGQPVRRRTHGQGTERVQTEGMKAQTATAKPQTEGMKTQTATAKPQTEGMKAQTATAKPQTEGMKAQTTTTKPQTEAVKSRTAAAKPQTDTVKLQTEVVKAQIDTAKPQTEAVKAKTDTVKPQTEAVKTPTAAAKPQTEAAETKASETKPQTLTETRKTLTGESKPQETTGNLQTEKKNGDSKPVSPRTADTKSHQEGRIRTSDNRTQGSRGQGQNRGQGGYGNRQQGGGRYQNEGQERNQDKNQDRNQEGQGSRGGQSGYGNRQQGGFGNRQQGGGRYQNDGQGRNQDRNQEGQGGRGGFGNRQQGGYANRQQGGGRYQNDGQSRNQDDQGARGGQGGNRNVNIPKAPTESKPLEKESRKRTERGDRNRGDKGEKLERMEKNVRQTQKNGKKPQPVKTIAPKPVEKPEETIRNITIPEKLTLSELADAMKVQVSAVIKKLFLQGTMLTVNQELEFEKAEEIALEFNCICEKEVKVDVIEELLKEEEDAAETMVSRPPVVCVMGHVDHGKTSLLDAIRNTHVIDREAGGITQHIGASVVTINGQSITFLDTPGHEAFTAMRMRGANSTDIAILVVAADDGVMPQTVEAINHAKAAGIEIIVAINKIDKPSANIERVKQELTEYGLIAEDWGGSTVIVPVSAHTHEGIDNLLEMILLTAEVLELKANPKRKARGLVIEAKLDKGKGPVATVLVQKGTLRVGDPVAAGSCYGKVRAMMDDKGRRAKEAGPSTPVEILGFSDVPNAGEIFMCMDNEKDARSFAETFISEGRERMLEETRQRMSLDDLFSQIQAGNLKELNLIVKADVQGSVEAVKQSLLKLTNEEVVVKVIHGGVGAINESDVILASASNAIIIGFNVRPDVVAKATAEREGVDVRLYRVIYDAIADVESAMKGMLDPIFEEKVIGHAEVRQTFRASGVGTIAGSYVQDGIFQRGCSVRISREGKMIYEGTLASLKRFKDDVKEVKAGYECGLVFEKFNDVKEEDQIEAYIMVEVPR